MAPQHFLYFWPLPHEQGAFGLSFFFPVGLVNALAACDLAHALARSRGLSIAAEGADVVFTEQEAVRPQVSRGAVVPEIWQQVASFAALTYVPETDASRLAGAGAGLSDND